MSSGNGQRRQIQQSVRRRSAASSIRCGSSRSRQLSTRGRCTCASAIHTQPLYSAARALDWYDGIRAIKWRPMRNIGRPRFSSSCSINPGTDGFAGEEHAPRRPWRSGTAVPWLLYIDFHRESADNARGFPESVASKFTGSSNTLPCLERRDSAAHGVSRIILQPKIVLMFYTIQLGAT